MRFQARLAFKLLVAVLGFALGALLLEFTKQTDFTSSGYEKGWEELAQVKLNLKDVKEEHELLDFPSFANKLRIYKRLINSFHERNHPRQQQLMERYEQAARSIGKPPNQEQQQKLQNESSLLSSASSSLLFDLERDLFPWAHYRFPTLLNLKNSFQGRGIVIPAGSKQMRFALHLLRSLRYFNCTLPIIIAYSGSDDLTKEDQHYLQHNMQVGLMDVTQYFDNNMLKLEGYAIKPFALLAAPFKEVILIDADCVLLRDPEVLFSDEGYLRHHIILFTDRTVLRDEKRSAMQKHWFATQMPLPLSETVLQSRMYKGKSAFEVESGVVVWNKKHRFCGLLAACKMNAFVERTKLVYQVFWGDKESFWLGPELAKETFTYFQPTPAGIGILGHMTSTNEESVCDCHIMHLDRQGWPLWFNAGIVANKYSQKHPWQHRQTRQFTHWAIEGTWEWESGCLNGRRHTVNETMGAILNDLISLWNQYPSHNI